MTDWAPVLYARTLHDDTWWRAAPHDRMDDPWLTGQVRTVVAGGRDLDRHTRFLLANDGTSRLFGVACASSRLSRTMNQTGGRPTYCFAGWVCEPPASAAAIPPWDVLMTYWVRWAAGAYDRWVAPDWSLSLSDRGVLPHPTPYAPLPAPWPTAAEGDSAVDADGAELASPSQRHGGTQAWPMSDAPRLWAAAAATADRVTAVFGVARAEPWRLRGITHAAALDLSQQQIVPGAAEPGRPAKTGDGPEPGVTRGKGRALIMKWRKRA
jgi:hypothetical protein